MPTWDPAALLHPTKRAQGTTKADLPSTHSHIPSAVPSAHDNSRPVTFQFTSTNGENLDPPGDTELEASSNKDLRCVPEETSINGVGNWIERMNNVYHRSAVPQAKRRKTEDGQDFSSKANAHPVHSGNGFLGDYVKEKQKENTILQSKTDATVDLTLSAANEDEVAIVRDPNSEEVCYGMVKSRLNCSKVPAPKPGTRSLWGPSYQPAIKIILRRQINEKSLKIQASDHTREIIGVVEPASAAAFCPLLDTNIGLRTDCRIPHHHKKVGEESGQPISRSYTLDIVWYGPRKHGRAVGKLLQKHNLKLITPYIVQNGIKVDNPHTAEIWPTQPRSSLRAVAGSISTVANRTVEEIRSEVMSVFDSLKRNDELPTMDPDPCITTPLLKYQKQGLYFMAMRERSLREQSREEGMVAFWRPRTNARGERIYSNAITGQEQRTCPPESRGGILADMMGLGKTLSILSLVASTKEAAQKWRLREPVQRPSLNSRPRKGQEPATLEQQQPRLESAPVIRQVKATLIICPLSTITNWEEQIKQHTSEGSLTYYVYHGSGRIKDTARLGAFDIVLTTYGSVSNELSARRKGKDGLFPLEEISWFRVVLDEAHMIREQSTLQFKAVCRLQAERRWAVTGTPVQNRLDDFAALLAFLRLHPFDERSKFVRYIFEPFKACDPEIVPKLRVLVDTITLRRLKDKIDLPPRKDVIVRLDFSAKEKAIYDLFAQNAKDRVTVLAGSNTNKALGGNTYIHILKAILHLRLLCAHGKDLLNDEDLGALQGMSADMAIDIADDEEGDKAALSHQKAHDMFSLMQETNNDACIECQRRLTSADGQNDDMETPGETLGYMTPCFHVLCHTCVKDHQDRANAILEPGQRKGPCPVCNAVIRPNYVALRRTDVDAEHNGPVKSKNKGSKKHLDKYDGPHTKTKALIKDLLKSKEASNADPSEPPFKSVVFSGWTSHLNLIEVALKDAQISFRRLDGTMSRAARTAAMDSFREDASVEVILVSIMAGGLGLNLTAANNVYVMEPQYNPAAEAQAVDRVHRLGQKRPVRSVRYIMRDSFEEKMLKLQEKKVKLASLSMDGQSKGLDKAEAARQKLMDLRSLFK